MIGDFETVAHNLFNPRTSILSNIDLETFRLRHQLAAAKLYALVFRAFSNREDLSETVA